MTNPTTCLRICGLGRATKLLQKSAVLYSTVQVAQNEMKNKTQVHKIILFTTTNCNISSLVSVHNVRGDLILSTRRRPGEDS